MKPRLLFLGEHSSLSTGFGKINKEIISRIYERGNIEVAELGSYVENNDPRMLDIPWKSYGGKPGKDDTLAHQRIQQNHFHQIYGQFGSSVFEQVCLDFQPDMVFCHTDFWMSSQWILKSPYRHLFKFLLCPTCDSQPIQNAWLDDLHWVDNLISLSDYGRDAIKEEANLEVQSIWRPGVDPKRFHKLENRNELHEFYNIPTDAKIVGMVGRNQPRKLIPRLFEAILEFYKYCYKKNKPNLAKKTYFLLHSSYPDIGFDFPKYLNKTGLGHRILFTYKCMSCNNLSISTFIGKKSICPHCQKGVMTFPNTQNGVSEDQMVQIYNMMNVHTIYSNCEGLGIPNIEARACEVPIMAVDYSASAYQAHEPGGHSIRVQTMLNEPDSQTGAKRALPDNKDFAKQTFRLLTRPQETHERDGKAGRDFVYKNYSYDRAADIIEEIVLNTEYPDHKETWLNTNLNLCPQPEQPPANLSPTEFVDWCILNILGKPEKLNTWWRDDIVDSLKNGVRRLEKPPRLVQFEHEECLKYFLIIQYEEDYFEKLRYHTLVKKQSSEIKPIEV